VSEYIAATQAFQVEQRRAVVIWGAILCSCPVGRERLTADAPPGELMCLVHGQRIIHPDTGEVI
jgi:hypothetical protein